MPRFSRILSDVRRPALAATLVAALLSAAPIPATAQEGDAVAEAPDLWDVEGEIGASVFFGNTEQTTVTSRAGVERSDSTWEVSADGGYSYGEATEEGGATFVNKRSWRLGAQLDHRPFDRWSPFVFANAAGSLEQRVDLRTDAGIGAKYTWVRTEPTRVDLSAAVLAERLEPRPDPEAPLVETESLARWSLRFRARHTLIPDRLGVSTVNFWQPRIDALDEFLFTSESSLSFQLTEVVSVKLTLLDTYDSEATVRGARTNNDGQLFFGVLASF